MTVGSSPDRVLPVSPLLSSPSNRPSCGFFFSVIHCRCAKCFSYPTKRRIRRRPRNLTILNLPEDVLFHILKWLSVGDILAVRAVSCWMKVGPPLCLLNITNLLVIPSRLPVPRTKFWLQRRAEATGVINRFMRLFHQQN